MNRRAVITALICGLWAPPIKIGVSSQNEESCCGIQGASISMSSPDELTAIELDIEVLKKGFKGKVWGLVVKYDNRKVCLTPTQVLDILEGKG